MRLLNQFLVSFVPLWFKALLRAFAPLREAFFCLSILLVLGAAHAENWDRFRGPNGAGQSDDDAIPSTWEEKNFLWKQPLPGIGHSSPVIWENRLFLTSADPATGTQIVSSFDVRTGATLWQKKLDASTYHIHDQNSLASSTPAVDAGHLYVLWLGNGQVSLAAFTHAGDELWRRDVGPFKEKHGFGTSPVVVDDLVLVALDCETDGGLSAFDRETGESRWTLPQEPSTTAYSTPCLLDPNANQKLLLATNTALGLFAVDAASGKIVWQGFKDDLDQRCVSSPVVAGGLIYVGCGQGGNGKLLLAAQPGDGSSPPAEVFRIGKSTPQVPTPVVAGDLLFVWNDKGIVSCHDAMTGKQHWLERIGGNFHSSPLRIGNRVFGFSRGGEAIVLAADKKFEVLARNDLKESCVATPAVSNHRLYLRTDSTLHCIGQPVVE
jgi:outer membrane protein assembly factor BamB